MLDRLRLAVLVVAAAVPAAGILAAAPAAAAGWQHICDDCAATAADCPFLDHGDGTSLALCEAGCNATFGCNAINFAATISDCVFRACSDPLAPNVSANPGYSVWTLPSRPQPPPGCWPGAPHRASVAAASAPPASWAAAIARGDMLFAADDSALEPQYLLPQLGNGFLATQVMTTALFVSGIFSGYLTSDPSHRARIPSMLAVPAPGAPVTGAAFDTRSDTFLRRSAVAPSPPGACTAASSETCSNAGATIWVEQRFYAHRALPSVLVMEVEVLAADDASAALPAAAPYAMLALRPCPSAPSADLDLAPAAPPPGAPFTLLNGSTRVAETNSSGLQALAVLTSTLGSAGAAPGMLLVPAPGVTHAFFMVVRSSIETAPGALLAAVQADYATAAALAAAGTLAATHAAAWASGVWAGGVELTGRPALAALANASLAALAGSIRGDRPFAFSSSGLSGAGDSQQGYNGHVFWDADLFHLPVFALLAPDLAAAIVAYRTARLAGAAAKAASYSPPWQGTMFPWESASTGDETCPSWAPTGLREQHISADVAVGAWWVWRTQQQGNMSALSGSYAMLRGIAEFWLARVGAPDAAGARHICNVIPPDEYADHVCDSVYTNAGAKFALQAAAAAADALGRDPGAAAAWRAAADTLPILLNASGASAPLHPEYAAYDGATIKQADVVLLGFPLQAAGANLTAAARANDLVYYAARTDVDGPAMTWALHAVGAAEIGDEASAAAYLNLSVVPATLPFGVWMEEIDGGCPMFVTGGAGLILSLVFGYPRLRLNDTALTLSAPLLPEGVSAVKLRGLAYLGSRVDVAYDAAQATFTLQREPAEEGEGEEEELVEGSCAGAVRDAPRRAYAPLWTVRAEAAAAAGGHRRPYGLRVDCSDQRGRVVVDGARVRATPLVVIDAAGASHALLPGAPVTLPVAQRLVITAAAPADLPLSRSRRDVGQFA